MDELSERWMWEGTTYTIRGIPLRSPCGIYLAMERV